MIITIDTEADSPESIRKAITFLQSLADTSEPTPAPMDMFDFSSSEQEQPSEPENTDDDSSDNFRLIPY